MSSALSPALQLLAIPDGCEVHLYTYSADQVRDQSTVGDAAVVSDQRQTRSTSRISPLPSLDLTGLGLMGGGYAAGSKLVLMEPWLGWVGACRV